jgi:DNA-nicking Smr family endonuclease
MNRRHKPRSVREDERALWDQVTARAKPLSREGAGNIVAHGADHAPGAPKPPHQEDRTHPAPLTPFELGARSGAQGGATITYAPPPGDPHVQMDRKAFQRMRRGKLMPEARIDLHGMTLDRAHPVLIRFISDAHARGLRLVLVITGKGKDRDTGGPIPQRRGVLRHQVPDWLRMPPIGGHVLQVTAASRTHGGEGAWYVYLRRRRG